MQNELTPRGDARVGRRGRRTALREGPHPVDVHVGGRLRVRRLMLGWSQMKLAEALGLTFQQVQKYERGANRLSASRLYELTQILDVPITYFFEGLPSRTEQKPASAIAASSPAALLEEPESIRLISTYRRIRDPRAQSAIRDLIYACARAGTKESEPVE